MRERTTKKKSEIALEEQITGNRGVIISEIHDERSSTQLLIENMPMLKAQGVKYIFHETFLQDSNQAIDQQALRQDIIQLYMSEKGFRTNSNESLAIGQLATYPAEQERIRRLFVESGKFTNDQFSALKNTHLESALLAEKDPRAYNKYNLLKTAAANGITIISIGSKSMSALQGTERLEMFNSSAHAQIESVVAHDRDARFVMVCGQAHAYDYLGVKGMIQRLDVPVIDVYNGKKDETYKEVTYHNQMLNKPVTATVITLNNIKNSDTRNQRFIESSIAASTFRASETDSHLTTIPELLVTSDSEEGVKQLHGAMSQLIKGGESRKHLQISNIRDTSFSITCRTSSKDDVLAIAVVKKTLEEIGFKLDKNRTSASVDLRNPYNKQVLERYSDNLVATFMVRASNIMSRFTGQEISSTLGHLTSPPYRLTDDSTVANRRGGGRAQ